MVERITRYLAEVAYITFKVCRRIFEQGETRREGVRENDIMM